MNAVAVDRDTREAVEAFMFREAELLDGRQFREWLGLLDPDIRYVVPVRTTREDSAGWVGAIAHWNDDYTGLEMRVLRGETDFSWAESPRSRTRHFVSNIRTTAGPGTDELTVRSNLLFFRRKENLMSIGIAQAGRVRCRQGPRCGAQAMMVARCGRRRIRHLSGGRRAILR